jgi:hypothetical protein
MDEKRKVVSIRKFKAKRRFKLLKRILSLPVAVIILLSFFGIISSTQSVDTKENPMHNFKEAKADLMQFNPDSMASAAH